MKKFIFRLETLLKLRTTREIRMQRELAYTEQKWAQLKEKQKSVEKQMLALEEEIRKKREKKEYGLQETYTQLFDHLRTTLSQTQEALAMQAKQIVEKKAQLKQLVIEKKVIEKIKEKQYAHWRIQNEYAQRNLIDETVQQSYSE